MLTRTLLLTLLLGLAACGTADAPGTELPPRSPGSGTTSTSASPLGGPVDSPTPVEAVAHPLDWSDTGVAPEVRFVQGAEWKARANPQNTVVDLVREGESLRVAAGADRTVSEMLLDDDWAVIVTQDSNESTPGQAVVIDLATGEQRSLVTPEPANGGSWALTGGDLYYPTYGEDRAYCLAARALADKNGEDGWCAPERSGWSGLTASEAGVGLMTFDDTRPIACRTVNVLDGSGLPHPLEGPRPCVAWDVAATPDGAVWSEVRQPRRQEKAHFFASIQGQFVDLGPGTTGTAIPCGDSIFFVRDPQSGQDPARLMRWTPRHRLQIAYESPSVGNAFLGEPACAGDVLTLTSFGEARDEQVWASVS